MTEKSKKHAPTLNRQIQSIRQQIAAMGLVAQGTVSKRTKVCGRPNCRCAQDPEARHGPYYEWTRRQNGRYVHTVISAEQAKKLVAANVSATGRWQRLFGDPRYGIGKTGGH